MDKETEKQMLEAYKNECERLRRLRLPLPLWEHWIVPYRFGWEARGRASVQQEPTLSVCGDVGDGFDLSAEPICDNFNRPVADDGGWVRHRGYKMPAQLSVQGPSLTYVDAQPSDSAQGLVKEFIDSVERIAFEMPAPNAYTPRFVQLCIQAREILTEPPGGT